MNVTGQIKDCSRFEKSATITFTPKSTPIAESPAVIVSGDIITQSDTSGLFTVELGLGDYEVKIGADTFLINVPTNAGSDNIVNLIVDDLTPLPGPTLNWNGERQGHIRFLEVSKPDVVTAELASYPGSTIANETYQYALSYVTNTGETIISDIDSSVNPTALPGWSGIQTIEILDAGSGHAIDDVISFSGGAGLGSELRVLNVDGGGAITEYEWVQRGNGYQIDDVLDQDSTSGSGIDLQIKVLEVAIQAIRLLLPTVPSGVLSQRIWRTRQTTQDDFYQGETPTPWTAMFLLATVAASATLYDDFESHADFAARLDDSIFPPFDNTTAGEILSREGTVLAHFSLRGLDNPLLFRIPSRTPDSEREIAIESNVFKWRKNKTTYSVQGAYFTDSFDQTSVDFVGQLVGRRSTYKLVLGNDSSDTPYAFSYPIVAGQFIGDRVSVCVIGDTSLGVSCYATFKLTHYGGGGDITTAEQIDKDDKLTYELVWNGSAWVDITAIVTGGGGGSGDVVGPGSATDNALVRFNLTTGKLIQNSTAILTDLGALTVDKLTASTEAHSPIFYGDKFSPDSGGIIDLTDTIKLSDLASPSTLLAVNASNEIVNSSWSDSGLTSAFALKVALAGDTMTGLLQFSGTGHLGLKLNSLTTTQRDALTSAAGHLLWNSTASRFQFSTGVNTWKEYLLRDGDTMTGNLLFSTDNTKDIGATGATRPRTGYFGTSLIVPTLDVNAITSVGSITSDVDWIISGNLNAADLTASGGLYGANLSLAGGLLYGGANLLEQRNSTNAQLFRVYNTYTDASNYELGGFGWNTNVLEVGTFQLGTGTARSLQFVIGGTSVVKFSTAGHLLWNTDNTLDVGATGATRPRTGYFGTSVVSPSFVGTLTGAASLNLLLTGGTLTGDLLFTDATYDIGKTGATRPRDIFLSRNLTIGGTTALGGNVVSDLLFTDATYDIGKTGATRPRDIFLSRNLTIGGTTSFGGNVVSNVLFTDNTYDIGATGATRPRTGYFGTSIVTPLVTIAAAANANGLALTGYSLTSANTQSMFDLAGTWNTSGAPTALKLTITDTASANSAFLMSLIRGSTSEFRVSGKHATIASASVWESEQSTLGILAGSNIILRNSTTWGGTSLTSAPGRLDSSGITFASTSLFAWTSSGNPGGTVDLSLYRDAANVLALRNSTNRQEFRLYNTFTDASNYERGGLSWSAIVNDYLALFTKAAGTGSARNIWVNSAAAIYFTAGGGGSGQWQINTSGHLLGNTDNTFDIGATGATRPRTGYFGTSLISPILDSGAATDLIFKYNATEIARISSGEAKFSKQYYSARFALTDGATIAIDWNNGNVQGVTLAGNRAITFSNPKAGARYLIALTQDGTGTRTITSWPTIKWQGGSAPTLTTTINKTDLITIVYDGTDYFGSSALNF